MVKKISEVGIKSGVNLLVSDFNADEAKSVYAELLSNGITSFQDILLF